MTTTGFLLQNITELFTHSTLMGGGGNNLNKTLKAVFQIIKKIYSYILFLLYLCYY